MRLASLGAFFPLMASTSLVGVDVEVTMDWPNRNLWSRVAWFRVRVRFWRAGRASGGASDPHREPAWWNEFEEAFWAHVRARTSGAEEPRTRVRRNAPRTPD